MASNFTDNPFEYYKEYPSAVYSDIIEPIFCILYLYVIFKIACSRSKDLHSAFFKFAVTTGISAILNIYIHLIIILIDIRFWIMPDRGLLMNILCGFSHSFALSMTLGKILSVMTRFTSVCYPFIFHRLWAPRHVHFIIAAQFLLPFAIYSYFPFMEANMAQTDDGYGHYLGTAPAPYTIAKSFDILSYLLFFVTTIPMCIATVVKLYENRKKMMRIGVTTRRANEARRERTFAFCSVVLTLAHALKATQQTIWFVGLIINAPELQEAMISIYIVPNSITSFVEPILLLITSPALKKEIFGSGKSTNYNSLLVREWIVGINANAFN